jgi:ribonuclease Z
MSARELVVLGTASQVPTRCRNHHGAYLRWDDVGLIFDPGEGTQRQMSRFGVRANGVHHLLVTHFHGDHCLGVPGVVQRLSLDRVEHEVHAWFPKSGQVWFDRLRRASIFEETARLVEHPIADDGVVFESPAFALRAARLDHRVEAFGYRLQEPDGVRLLPEKLAACGLRGPAVGALLRDGSVVAPSGQTVTVGDVGVRRPGQGFAFIMDTRLCDAAIELARGADLVVAESTFLTSEAAEAARYGHMTAADAATLAREAGARRLVLTHFSQRYPDARAYHDEAAGLFDDVVVAEDGLVVPVPPRRPV